MSGEHEQVEAGTAETGRWTVSRRLTALVVIALTILGSVGFAGYYSAGRLHELAAQQRTLAQADALLADLDMQESNIQAAMRTMLLATTDPEYATARQAFGAAATAADRNWSTLQALRTDSAPQAALRALRPAYDAFVAAEQPQLDVALKIQPGTPSAQRFLAADDVRAGAIQQRITGTRKIVNAASARAGAKVQSTSMAARRTALIGLLVGVVLLSGIGWALARSVLRPLEALCTRVAQVAAGDLTVRLDSHRRDEIGAVARAVNQFITMVHGLTGSTARAATTLSGEAQSLAVVSQQLATGAEETNAQAATAADAAEEVSRGIETLAAGGEEMIATIREIASSASDAARVAGEAVSTAHNANGTVTQLGASTDEIIGVVKLITSIAEQTNLLALNATIEAARAGDAGKGFAVVAGEVKDLAQATAKATQEISDRIGAITTDSEAAVLAIAQISEVIERVNDYATTIASAVEEQTATTSEMGRTIQEAATGANAIARNITGVATATSGTANAAAVSARTSTDIAAVVEELNASVRHFRL